jgi:hypothetical protein
LWCILRKNGGEKMVSRYLQNWETYKKACEKEGHPIQGKEEPCMRPILENYDLGIRNFIISLLL